MKGTGQAPGTSVSGLSIVIPAYNEADSLREIVPSILEGIPRALPYELILVDDGSTDGSGPIIDSLAARKENIRVIRHPVNLGKGAALTSGFASATKEWLLFLDADGQIPLSELPGFLRYTGQYDMIIGYRTRRRYSLTRRCISRAYRTLTAMMLGLTVRDVGCPFKLFRRSILGNATLCSRGFIVDVELIQRAVSGGRRLKELPVVSRPRRAGASTVTVSAILKTLVEFRRLAKRKDALDGKTGV